MSQLPLAADDGRSLDGVRFIETHVLTPWRLHFLFGTAALVYIIVSLVVPDRGWSLWISLARAGASSEMRVAAAVALACLWLVASVLEGALFTWGWVAAALGGEDEVRRIVPRLCLRWFRRGCVPTETGGTPVRLREVGMIALVVASVFGLRALISSDRLGGAESAATMLAASAFVCGPVLGWYLVGLPRLSRRGVRVPAELVLRAWNPWGGVRQLGWRAWEELVDISDVWGAMWGRMPPLRAWREDGPEGPKGGI